MNLLLKITCKTAVTPASGESWGGVIDTDIVYDGLGIPFIPARRIKGILRESAIDIVCALQNSKTNIRNCSENDVYALFGTVGQDKSCELVIDNAYIENYTDISSQLQMLKSKTTGLATPEQVLDLFTGTRAQTAVANSYYHKDQSEGIALEHSLRLQRVLNRGLVLKANIEIKDTKYISLLAMSVQVSRNLGLNRNRGLGCVEMELLDTSGINQFSTCIKKSDFGEEVANDQ